MSVCIGIDRHRVGERTLTYEQPSSSLQSQESGKLDGGFVPVDFAMSGAYRVKTLDELHGVQTDARQQTVSTLIDIKCCPRPLSRYPIVVAGRWCRGLR
ncbi:hypothetical protein PMI18_03057 [Pseudomonas sp. GM102]|uniref:hypothetical protein n=1 Tax=Pseudomonas sp. GM102 TaxID=1144321 RepID=UPI00026F6F29|nr:hypothetical protein [Pseudomonas sp. GM102]EJM00329.1 hypothetical protein PMI18_03057 [Pseudomonas sp. GM102]